MLQLLLLLLLLLYDTKNVWGPRQVTFLISALHSFMSIMSQLKLYLKISRIILENLKEN